MRKENLPNDSSAEVLEQEKIALELFSLADQKNIIEKDEKTIEIIKNSFLLLSNEYKKYNLNYKIITPANVILLKKAIYSKKGSPMNCPISTIIEGNDYILIPNMKENYSPVILFNNLSHEYGHICDKKTITKNKKNFTVQEGLQTYVRKINSEHGFSLQNVAINEALTELFSSSFVTTNKQHFDGDSRKKLSDRHRLTYSPETLILKNICYLLSKENKTNTFQELLNLLHFKQSGDIIGIKNLLNSKIGKHFFELFSMATGKNKFLFDFLKKVLAIENKDLREESFTKCYEELMREN